jgi:hypothetical protein
MSARATVIDHDGLLRRGFMLKVPHLPFTLFFLHRITSMWASLKVYLTASIYFMKVLESVHYTSRIHLESGIELKTDGQSPNLTPWLYG